MLFKILVGLLLVSSLVFGQNESQEFIRTKVELLKQYNELKIGDAWIAFPSVLADFYENRDFLPAWSEDNADRLREAIEEIELDGLNPIDYHSVLLNQVEEKVDAGLIKDYRIYAARDMLLTDAFLRLAYHIIFGKVDADALDPHWNMTAPIGDLTPAVTLERLLAENSVSDSLNAWKPQNPIYIESKKTLQQYRDIAAAGTL